MAGLLFSMVLMLITTCVSTSVHYMNSATCTTVANTMRCSWKGRGLYQFDRVTTVQRLELRTFFVKGIVHVERRMTPNLNTIFVDEGTAECGDVIVDPAVKVFVNGKPCHTGMV